jgi:Flp pilus assembly protein TadB
MATRIDEGEITDPDANWYTRACLFVSRRFGNTTKRKRYHERREQLRKRNFERAEERFRREEAKFLDAEKRYKRTDRRFKLAENRYRRELERFSAARKKYVKDEFTRAIKFARLGVEPYDINLFAAFIVLLAIMIMIVFDFILFIPLTADSDRDHSGVNDLLENIYVEEVYNKTQQAMNVPNPKIEGYEYIPGGISPIKLMLYIITPTVIVPIILMAFIASYPEKRAKRLRIQTLGRMPEAINYMSMAMHLTPSLDRAVDYAAENIDEPLATNLKRILWNVYVREHDSIEDSFISFAYDWGDWNEDFKRALYAIRSATLEKTREGLHRCLEKANQIILEGSKMQIEKFANALGGPTMVLFSLGILLPLMLTAMLPMAGLGEEFTFQLALLLDVLLPVCLFAYAYRILGRRPGTTTPPQVPSRLTSVERRAIIITAVLMAIGLIGFGIMLIIVSGSATGPSGNFLKTISALPIVWGIGLPLAYYCKLTSLQQKRERDLAKKMESEFPDALFQLGSRIAEGKPIEHALEKTANSMEGTEISTVFRKISYHIQISRAPLRDALFGMKGVLRDSHSRTIKATMRTVVESVKKDAATAGAIIINFSNYLRELKKVEHDTETRMNQVMTMMVSTAMIFAPIVMGITVSLYFMLSRILGEIPPLGGGGMAGLGFGVAPAGAGFGSTIAPEIFSLIIGIYLVITVIIIVYFVAGIRHGEDMIERKVLIGNGVPIALIVYTFAIILGSLIVGA